MDANTITGSPAAATNPPQRLDPPRDPRSGLRQPCRLSHGSVDRVCPQGAHPIKVTDQPLRIGGTACGTHTSSAASAKSGLELRPQRCADSKRSRQRCGGQASPVTATPTPTQTATATETFTRTATPTATKRYPDSHPDIELHPSPTVTATGSATRTTLPPPADGNLTSTPTAT